MSHFAKSLKPVFEKTMSPLISFFEQKNIDPNTLSLLGLLSVGLGSFFLYKDYNHIATLFIAIGGLLDALDGALARLSGKASSFGAFLDSTLDRLSDAMPIVALVLLFAKNQDLMGVFVGLFAMVFSFMVSYTKARSHSLGVDIPIGVFERTERFSILILSIFFGFYKLGLFVVGLGAFYTTIERIIYAKNHLTV
jgi:phosphatidylglycerophosphate synthase